MSLSSFQKSFVLAGAFMFLIGLLQGAAVHSFANPRMALSAHLTAVQCGMALMIAGILWSAVSLAPGVANVARMTIVLGMYLLWVGLTLAAATGASDVLPIAGAGFGADRGPELLVTATVLGGSGLMTLGWLLLLVGLLRSQQP